VLFRILMLGLIPLLVSAIYVRAWPGVTSRPLLVGILGALSGLSASLVALVWTVYPALTAMRCPSYGLDRRLRALCNVGAIGRF